jgi:hypothetical protein
MATESEKKEHLAKAMNGTSSWYAACESGHPFWVGPDHDTYAQAASDATAHDAARHGGVTTAVVLNS